MHAPDFSLHGRPRPNWRLGPATCRCRDILRVQFTVRQPVWRGVEVWRQSYSSRFEKLTDGTIRVPQCVLKSCGIMHWVAGRVAYQLVGFRPKRHDAIWTVYYQQLLGQKYMDRWLEESLSRNVAKIPLWRVRMCYSGHVTYSEAKHVFGTAKTPEGVTVGNNVLHFSPGQPLLSPLPCSVCGRDVKSIPYGPRRVCEDEQLDAALGRPVPAIGCSEICMNKIHKKMRRYVSVWQKEKRSLEVANNSLKMLRVKLSRASTC